MRRFLLLLLLVCRLLFSFGQARCGFDEKMKELLKDPEGRRIQQLVEKKVQSLIAAPRQQRGNTTLTVPVVIHVMHTGGEVGSAYNPNDATLSGAINYLNQVFAGTYNGMEGAVEGGGVVNMNLTFVLAQRTPSCGATNGIDRVNASFIPGYAASGVKLNGTTGCSDIDLKDFARWNPAEYYNIWIVNKIDGNDGTTGSFIAGYSFYPGSPPSLDGIVMLASQFTAGKTTLPHEMGHAFNLYHTFQGSNFYNDCPVNNDCSLDGDKVCDTDPISNNVDGNGNFNFTCRSDVNPCTINNTPYTKNTEHNFMSYTSCRLLFTNGQKTRVEAATELTSRSGFRTSSALTPCSGTRVINFLVAAASKTESKTGTAAPGDCRTYTDNVYQMTISSAPGAATVATLAFSGTATRGYDYEVFTNGNFSLPGNTLTFNAGSTAAQLFTVRIFDDAATEPAETIVFDFSLTGDDAVKGSTNPTFTLTLYDNDEAPHIASSGGNIFMGIQATVTNDGASCFRSSKIKHRVQYLVTKAELNNAGITNAATLSGLKLRVQTKNSTKPFNGFTVSLAHTKNTRLGNFVIGTFLQVYKANYATMLGENMISFTSNFNWDGADNIVVNICFENADADSGDDILDADHPNSPNPYSAYAEYTSGTTAGCNLSASLIHTLRPNIAFIYSIAATPISTLLNQSSTAYLGPNDSVYFYDGAGAILSRVKNLTSFNFGCTEVSIDRAVTASASSQFWNDNPANYLASKTYKAIPANSNPNGNYQITLYYTTGETSGYNNAATPSNFSTAQMVKVSNGVYIPAVTPSNPYFADAYVSPATISSFGAGGSLVTATFNNTSLSGFGVGTPGNSITSADFRTKSSGSFTDVSKWEYNIFGSNFIDAHATPVPGNNVNIKLSHVIDLDADQIVGSGKKIIVDGTLNAATHTISGVGSFELSSGATLSTSNSGTSGLSENITVTGDRIFNDGASYNFNAATTKPFGDAFTLVRPKNLAIGANITLDKPVFLQGTLGFTGSTLNLSTGDLLTLVSNNAGTAIVTDVTRNFLTGQPISGNAISGNVTVERFIGSPSAKRAYRLLTAPLRGNTGNSIFDTWQNGRINMPGVGTWITAPVTPSFINGIDGNSPGYSLQKIVVPGGNLTGVGNTKSTLLFNNTTGTIAGNNSYFLFVRGDRIVAQTAGAGSTTLRATGTLQTGDQRFSLNTASGGLTLVGNPYASPVSFNALATDPANTSITKNYYFWDPNKGVSSSVGGYISVSRDIDGVRYNIVPPNSGNETYTTDIQSGQAVFLVTANGSDGFITFREAHKSGTVLNTVFRNGTHSEKMSIGLSLVEGSTITSLDGTLARYNNGYTAAVGAYDVNKLTNAGENIYLYRDGFLLAIESRPLVDDADTLFIRTSNLATKSYQLIFTPEAFDAPGLTAFIEDKYLHTSTPISLNNVTTLSFSVNTAIAGSAVTDRFRLVYKQNAVLPLSFTQIKAYEKGSSIQVEWNMGNEQNIKQYEIEKSADGSTFAQAGSQSPRGRINRDNYAWIDVSPMQGNNYYRIKAIEKSGSFRYSQVVIVKLSKGVGSIGVYPNPISGNVMNLQLVNQPKGKYAIQLFNNLGQEVYRSEFNHAGGSSAQTIQLSYKVVRGIYQLQVTNGDNRDTQKVILD